jgi:hypothetical protein
VGGRSVDSEEAGRERSAPKSFQYCGAQTVSMVEGRILTTVSARLSRTIGVSSPGHVSKRIPQEPGRPLRLLLRERGVVDLSQQTRPWTVEVFRSKERRNTRREVPDVQGRPESSGKDEEESYEPIVPLKVGNRRATIRWRPRKPLEGRGEQADVSSE